MLVCIRGTLENRHLWTLDSVLKGRECLWGSPTKLQAQEACYSFLIHSTVWLLLNLLIPYPSLLLFVFPCKPIIKINKTIKPINLSSCLTNLVPSVLHAVANFRFPYHGHFKSVPDSLCRVIDDLDLVLTRNRATDVDIYHTFCAYSDGNILFSCTAVDIRTYIKVSVGLHIPKSSLWQWKPWALQWQKETKPYVQTNAFFCHMHSCKHSCTFDSELLLIYEFDEWQWQIKKLNVLP